MKNVLYERLKAVESRILNCVSDENLYLPEEYKSAHNIVQWWESALI